MATVRTVEIQGQKIWTESLGDPKNPPVLLISGAGAHAHFWTETFCDTLLKGGYFLIRYDHRDVGLSDPSENAYDLMTLTEDALEILNHYNLRAAHIVGHSMGGYIAQLLAAHFPERVLTITIISGGPVGETPYISTPPTDEERETLLQTWREMLHNRPTQDFEESFEGFMGVWKRLNGLYPVEESLARPYTQEMYTRSKYPVGPHKKHVDVMQKMAETLKERKEIFAKIKTPVLIIHGEEDYLMLPARGGAALLEVLPNAKYELVPRMGHMLFNHEVETKVAELVTAFFHTVRE